MKTKIKIGSILVLLLANLLLSAQSTTQNYIRTRIMTDAAGTASRNVIQYYDGLGRPSETVLQQASPNGYDLVSRPEYDNFGRQIRNWLPSPSTNKDGSYNGSTTAQAQYDDIYSYSETVYEPSPLNRVDRQYGPGATWRGSNDRKVKTEYLANSPGGDQSCGFYEITGANIIRRGTYTQNELSVIKVTDEDNNVSYEFKNKIGQVLMHRQIGDGKQHDTDYIYDQYGNLRFVLPPMAADLLAQTQVQFAETNDAIQKYAYLYHYDERNRCVEKKLPGAGWIYYVYDKADRLRLIQDAEQRARDEWTYNKYDYLGRIAVTGTCTKKASRTEMKTNIDANVVLWESISTANDGTYKLYTNNSYPKTADVTNLKELLDNYYDNYSYVYGTSYPASDFGYTAGVSDPEYSSSQGLLTGSRAACLDESGKYTYKIIRYDTYARPVQIKSTGTLANELNAEYYKYNFTGQVIEKNIRMKTENINEKYSYQYDGMGRLTKTDYTLNTEPAKTIATYSYDKFGRLETKDLAALDKSTYSYNLRGWLTKQDSPKLTEELFYTSCAKAGIYPQFGGNISARQWKTPEYATLRSNQYEYDQLGRMIHSITGEGNDMGQNRDRYSEHLSYDKNGNFQCLIRYGRFDNKTYGQLDLLTPQYNGNQLYKIIDSGNDQLSADVMENKFVWDQPYLYDLNGRMTADPNKKISKIEYNSVNLPRRITMKAGEKVEHTYNAEGVKMQTKYIYADGTSSSIDYIGNKMFRNNKLVRVTNDEGYYEPGFGSYYYIRDYLGNNRLVMDSKGTIVQATNYYAAGMSYAENPPRDDQHEQPYKFNGKLLNKNFNLDLYDYEARIYNPAIARFTTMDPLAEKYYSISPYAYCNNNPANYIDPTGMDWFRDNDGSRQYDPNITSQDQLKKEQTYIGTTDAVKDKNGNVTENYRDDGSIMYSNEASGYKRIWNNTQKTGNEEMGVITDNGVLVLPSHKNTEGSVDPSDYDYSWNDGKLSDPVSGNDLSISGTIHTHPSLEKDQNGNVVSSWNAPSREDFTYAGNNTPNIPFYVITADRVVHANIPRTPDIATPLKLGKRGSTLEGITYGHYSLKNRGK